MDYAQLSDAELQQELMKHNFQRIPVTETSRPILVKKLQKLASESAKIAKETTTTKDVAANSRGGGGSRRTTPTMAVDSAAAASREVPPTTNGTSGKTKSKSPPRRVAGRKSVLSDSIRAEESSNSNRHSIGITARTTPKELGAISSESESEDVLPISVPRLSLKPSLTATKRNSPMRQSRLSTTVERVVVNNSESSSAAAKRKSLPSSIRRPLPRTPRRRETTTTTTNIGTFSGSEEDDTQPEEDEEEEDGDEEARKLENATVSRLLSYRASTTVASRPSSSSSAKPSVTFARSVLAAQRRKPFGSSPSSASSIVTQADNGPEYLLSGQEVDSSTSSYNSLISITIISGLILFFVALMCAYWYKAGGPLSWPPTMPSSLDSDIHPELEHLSIPLCSELSISSASSDALACVRAPEERSYLLGIISHIKTLMDKKCFNSLCDGKTQGSTSLDVEWLKRELRSSLMPRVVAMMTAHHAINQGHGPNAQNKAGAEQDFEVSFFRLVNKALGIIESNAGMLKILAVRDSLFKEQISHLTFDPYDYPLDLPTACRIRLFFYMRLKELLVTFLFAALAFVAYQVHRFRRRASRAEQDEVEDLIEKVIELLQSPDEETQSVPVLHIRDTLLTANERRPKAKIWKRVVDFIEANESRIKVSHENIGGEEFKTWRWIGGPVTSALNNLSIRQANSDDEEDDIDRSGDDQAAAPETPVLRTGIFEWQGPATQESDPHAHDHRNLADFKPPTRYLKIRHLFDGETQLYDNWKEELKSAMCQKVSLYVRERERATGKSLLVFGGHGITFVEFDEESDDGIGFVKCSDSASASAVYKALHGWWLARQLITVKFLRSDRFYQRFPNAELAESPLRFSPSGDVLSK